MVEPPQSRYPDCPKCLAQPTVETAQWGRAWYALCSQCGWEGETRCVEASPESALAMWSRKAIEHERSMD